LGRPVLLLTHAGALEGNGRDEDQLAFTRSEHEYRNVTLVELPNGDFGATTLRNFLFSSFAVRLWETLQTSTDAELAKSQ
jgi:ring-1,2-phenylacetyl-CoA epoxidase subunit PaaC